MKFSIRRASTFRRLGVLSDEEEAPVETAEHFEGEWRIQVATLEDLMALVKRADARIVIDKHHQLLIYDDYIE